MLVVNQTELLHARVKFKLTTTKTKTNFYFHASYKNNAYINYCQRVSQFLPSQFVIRKFMQRTTDQRQFPISIRKQLVVTIQVQVQVQGQGQQYSTTTMEKSMSATMCSTIQQQLTNGKALAFATALVLLLAQCPKRVDGQQGQECHFPRLTPRHSLDLNRYMGTWFLHEFAASDPSFNDVVPQFRCSRVNYVGTPQELSRGRFTAFESFLNTTSGRMESFTVPISIPNLRNPVNAIWDAVTINGKTKMVVLGADNDHAHWTMLYGCNMGGPTGNYRWETIAIWSRTPHFNGVEREMLKSLLVGLGLPAHTHKAHSQVGC